MIIVDIIGNPCYMQTILLKGRSYVFASKTHHTPGLMISVKVILIIDEILRLIIIDEYNRAKVDIEICHHLTLSMYSALRSGFEYIKS